MTKVPVKKFGTEPCYHYFKDGEYIGAVWCDRDSKKWGSHCCVPERYEHLGSDFDSENAAYAALTEHLKAKA